MAGDLYYDGPMPDIDTAPLGWCTLCAMIYKGFANATEDVKDLVSKVNELEPGDQRRIDISKLKLPVGKPQPAVATFISPVLQGIVNQLLGIHPQAGMVAPPLAVPLCWSHLVGLSLQPGGGSQLVVASADALPAHQRGAVDLSRRERG